MCLGYVGAAGVVDVSIVSNVKRAKAAHSHGGFVVYLSASALLLLFE
jgi:hypothetical protein